MSHVELARRALGVGPLPVVARAVIDALRAHPVLNSRLGESGQELIAGDGVHLGVAVSVGFDGQSFRSSAMRRSCRWRVWPNGSWI